MPPFWKRDPEKVKQRKIRKARRKAEAAREAADKAEKWGADKEEMATLVATGRDGRELQQQIKLKKEGSRQRNERLKSLEVTTAKQAETIKVLEEEIDELQEQMLQLMQHLEQDEAQNVVFSSRVLGMAQEGLRLLNVRDVPHNPAALMLAGGLKLADAAGVMGRDQAAKAGLNQAQANWQEVLGTLLTAYAYYNPNQGIGSVFGPDRPQSGGQRPHSNVEVPGNR